MAYRDGYREREFWRDYDRRMDDRRYDQMLRERERSARAARTHKAIRDGDTERVIHETMGAEGVLRYNDMRTTRTVAPRRQRQPAAPNPHEIYEHGWRKEKAGDYAAAEPFYSRAIALDPDVSIFWYSRGVCRHQLGRFQEALSDLDNSLARKPGRRGIVHNQRALVRSRLEDFDGALEDFNIAVSDDPTEPAVWFNRAMCYVDRGEDRKAVDDFSAALKLRPKDPKILIRRGTAWSKSKHYKAAINDFNKAAKYDKENPRIYNRRAIAWRKQGETEKAFDDFSQAMKLDPSWGIPILNRAHLHFERRDHKLALADCFRATECFAKHGDEIGSRDAKALLDRIFSDT